MQIELTNDEQQLLIRALNVLMKNIGYDWVNSEAYTKDMTVARNLQERLNVKHVKLRKFRMVGYEFEAVDRTEAVYHLLKFLNVDISKIHNGLDILGINGIWYPAYDK